MWLEAGLNTAAARVPTGGLKSDMKEYSPSMATCKRTTGLARQDAGSGLGHTKGPVVSRSRIAVFERREEVSPCDLPVGGETLQGPAKLPVTHVLVPLLVVAHMPSCSGGSVPHCIMHANDQ